MPPRIKKIKVFPFFYKHKVVFFLIFGITLALLSGLILKHKLPLVGTSPQSQVTQQQESINASKKIPDDWSRFSVTNKYSSLKTIFYLPPPFVFKTDPQTFNELVTSPHNFAQSWIYKTSIDIRGCNSYYGQSRRQWYESFINGDYIYPKDTSIHEPFPKIYLTKVTEHPTNDSSYLEIESSLNKGSLIYLYVRNGVVATLAPYTQSEVSNPSKGITKNIRKIFELMEVERSSVDNEPHCPQMI